ncbi:MAG: HNH endonuclease [Byssovorax sp.]
MQDSRRERARQRFGHRCGYCGVHEDDAGATLALDHHRPRAHRGEDQSDNLVYACPRCNEHKGSYWHEDTPPHVRLLHPGHDALAAHLREDDGGNIHGTTPEGEFFVARLHLNRPQLVAYRRALRERRALSEQLGSAIDRMRALERRMNELGAEIDATVGEIDQD